MKQEVLSTYVSGDRKAEVFKDKYHYGVHMYKKESKAKEYDRWKFVKTELVENHNEYYAEDLAENYVQKWGKFKNGN